MLCRKKHLAYTNPIHSQEKFIIHKTPPPTHWQPKRKRSSRPLLEFAGFITCQNAASNSLAYFPHFSSYCQQFDASLVKIKLM